MTHADLVKLAARWLAKKHPVVVTEMSSGAMEEPDAIGFAGGLSTLVECKASRADFHADRHKPFNRLGHWRYYLTPRGLVTAEEIPPGWGLLWAENRQRSPLQILESTGFAQWNARGENALLVSCLRRVRPAQEQLRLSVRYYTIPNKCRATLGVQGIA